MCITPFSLLFSDPSPSIDTLTPGIACLYYLYFYIMHAGEHLYSSEIMTSSIDHLSALSKELLPSVDVNSTSSIDSHIPLGPTETNPTHIATPLPNVTNTSHPVLPVDSPSSISTIDSPSTSSIVLPTVTPLLVDVNATLNTTQDGQGINSTINNSTVSNNTSGANQTGGEENNNSNSPREKSVFLRLSNRINHLELNMSLFGSYLDQISSR